MTDAELSMTAWLTVKRDRIDAQCAALATDLRALAMAYGHLLGPERTQRALDMAERLRPLASVG